MMYAIDIENLTKRFNGFTAVDDVSLKISENEVFGLLGPNGAGKTTTISMLSTILAPTEGRALVNGFDVSQRQDDVRKSIGIVFQDQSLDEELTAEENMDFHGRMYRVPPEMRKKKSDELLKLVELYDRKDDLVKTFSGGMRRRLEIARGLLHEPKILFLDEPTLGLDPQTRNHLWEYIRKLNSEKGITIILTTHYMDEADRLCNRVAIIDHGKIIAMDTPENLKEAIGGEAVEVKSKDAAKLKEKLAGLDWVKKVDSKEDTLRISLQSPEHRVAGIANLAAESKIAIESIAISKPTLEDVFLYFTGRSIREEGSDGRERMRMIRRRRTR